MLKSYVAKIVEEAHLSARWIKAELGQLPPARSIFVGGGTPSLLPVPLLEELFTALTTNFAIDDDVEITLEANPETVDEEFARALKHRTPVNRVSLGAQSFEASHLAVLERLGSAESIASAIRTLKKAGFENYSLDLIFAIPGQTLATVLSDIEQAASLGPSHLSFYNLTLKEGHALYRGLPSEDLQADWYEAGVARLRELGFSRYEVSNFSRPGKQSRHNLLYWDGGDFLGLGPSAASRVFKGGVFRHRKHPADLDRYLATSDFGFDLFEPSTPEQTVLEATFLELRKDAGISLSWFRDRYRYDPSEAKNFSFFVKQGLINRSEDTVQLTPRGMLLADRVTRELVDV